MRDLLAETNIIEIRDEIGGVVHEVYYRMPTTTERMQFQGRRFERRDNQIVDRTYAQQVTFGLAIMTGMKKGTLAAGGRQVATDENDPDYREDWKELLRQAAPEIPAVVGRTVFGGVDAVRIPQGLEDTEVVVEEVNSDDPLDS